MTNEEFTQLKVGDIVRDDIKDCDLQVVEVRPESNFTEASIMFKRIEFTTIYIHGANTLSLIRSES